MGTLKAGVQYNDWLGTAAADRHDSRDLGTILEERGLLDRRKDFLFGVRFWSGENHALPPKRPTIYALISDAGTGANPTAIREVEVDLSFEEFFGAFKRFAIVLANKDADVEKDYPGVND